MEGRLIYLDNAATSFPKPPRVSEEMEKFMLTYGGNPGRGSHRLAIKAAEAVFDCRCKLAKLFGAEEPEQVVFTMNTTQGLNLCIKGLLHRGDHVLISDLEHNAVYRPIYKIQSRGSITYDIFPSLCKDPKRSAEEICRVLAKQIRHNTRMVICTGASNISSISMPLYEIGRLCRRLGVLFVVDGAQCAGHMPISVEDMCIDALCVPAHKGLLGPQGCGAVIFGKGIRADTLIEGGNGVESLEGAMSYEAPERYEAGTLPTPAIVGLSAGLDVINEIGIDRIQTHEKSLFRFARQRLEELKGVRIYTPEAEGSVLLFNIDGRGSEEVARALSDMGICLRGGYHCTALAHKTLGTPKGGALRMSFSPFNCTGDIEEVIEGIRSVLE